MVRYESKYVVCPFYHNEETLTIYCEGATENSTLLHAFRRTAEKKEYKEIYCCSMEGHKRCPIADALYRKYDEKQKG